MTATVLTADHRVRADVLDVACHMAGPADGPPVFLMHGFPYDIHSYVEVTPMLADAGCRVIVPYLRGHCGTRFLDAATPRSGEQAVLGADLLALMDALGVEKAVLAGYDWGGRAACVVAALWSECCAGLVSVNSYNLQQIGRAMVPDTPENERRLWYQYLFHSERGRAAVQADGRGLCRLLWELWSPTWAFDEACFGRSASAFDNPDFVEVVIHSYRHRFGLVPGDPAVADVERRITAQPVITPCRPSALTASPTAFGPGNRPARTPTVFPDSGTTASFPASGTTCRRRRRGSSPTRCSSWSAAESV